MNLEVLILSKDASERAQNEDTATRLVGYEAPLGTRTLRALKDEEAVRIPRFTLTSLQGAQVHLRTTLDESSLRNMLGRLDGTTTPHAEAEKIPSGAVRLRLRGIPPELTAQISDGKFVLKSAKLDLPRPGDPALSTESEPLASSTEAWVEELKFDAKF